MINEFAEALVTPVTCAKLDFVFWLDFDPSFPEYKRPVGVFGGLFELIVLVSICLSQTEH